MHLSYTNLYKIIINIFEDWETSLFFNFLEGLTKVEKKNIISLWSCIKLKVQESGVIMEKVRQDIYKQITIAYDYPETRDNPQLSSYLLAASNELIKNQNPILVAQQLNYQIDHYLALNDLKLPDSLLALKKLLSKYSD